MPPTGSNKKIVEEGNGNKLLPKRRTYGNGNEILHNIPWSAVFQFLGGEDVAKALMASKHQNPWKMELVEGNEQQCIVSALKDRMMATENGKALLERYYNNSPQFLPKLLYCMDHGYGIRYDGVYQGGKFRGTLNETNGPYAHYFRFYPTGEIISVSSTGTPVQVWRWFYKDSNGPTSEGTFECNFIPSGPNLFHLTSTIGFVKSLSIGENGELVLTKVAGQHIGWRKSATREYRFVKL